MIQVLGTKRILTLGAMLAANVVLAAGVYLYLMPQKMKMQGELNSMKSQVSTVQTDISRMQVEFEQLEQQQAQFDVLKADGFFGAQGRRQAEKILESIQKQAGVVAAVANIAPGNVEDNEEAQKAEHKILVSPINIRIEAMDDVDVYRYIYLMQKFFPGYVSVERIAMERKSAITGPVLRNIASGANPQLVHADIDVLWRTMIPQADVISPEAAPQ